MASFGSGFAQGLSSGAGLVQQMREGEYREKQREREQQQWDREDANRAAIQQLGVDAREGVISGTENDNSFDVAEGKRLGMAVPSTTTYTRKQLSDVDLEQRMGDIALQAGDLGGYRQSRTNRKALEQEAADKAFGADLQNIAAGDISTLGKYAKEYNKDTTTPGMVTLIQGKPHFVNPETGNPEPVSFAQIAQFLGASHAMGRGDWKTGASLLFQQQQYGDQRRDKATELGLQTRQVTNAETQTANNLTLGNERNAIDRLQANNTDRHFRAMEGLEGQKIGVERSKVGAMNNMGKFGPASIVTDANGNYAREVLVMGRNGEMTSQLIPFPPGWQPPKGMDPQTELKMATDLAANSPPVMDRSGKQRPMTVQEALEQVRSMTPRGRTAPNPVARDADVTIQFLRSQAAQQPAKPSGAMPGRPEPTTQAQRLRQMTLGQGSR